MGTTWFSDIYYKKIRQPAPFFRRRIFFNLFEKEEKDELSAECSDNIAHFIIKGKSALGSIDIKPVEDRALSFKDVIPIQGIGFSDFFFVFKFTRNGSNFVSPKFGTSKQKKCSGLDAKNGCGEDLRNFVTVIKVPRNLTVRFVLTSVKKDTNFAYAVTKKRIK